MHFPLSSCKTFPPTFSMLHLLHRLYGVDAPASGYFCYIIQLLFVIFVDCKRQRSIPGLDWSDSP